MVLVPFIVLSSVLTVALAYTWPSPQYDALEKFLYEGTDVNGEFVAFITAGCVHRTAPVSGRQQSTVAAEWLRTVYFLSCLKPYHK